MMYKLQLIRIMVPEWFERDWENAYHAKQGTTSLVSNDPLRTFDGYTDEMKQRLYNGAKEYTEAKVKQKNQQKDKPFRIDSVNS